MVKVSLKSEEEIRVMAEGGAKLAQILKEVIEKVTFGLSTLEIDSWVERKIIDFGGTPSFKKVRGYRWASCVGLNDEVVHSIPRVDKIIKKGDLLKIDMGMLWRGFNTDLSWTVQISQNSQENFLRIGTQALGKAIQAARPGNRVGNISQAIEDTLTRAGLSPVRVLTGHGIGQKLHEEPMVPGCLTGRIEDTPRLEEGMTLAIEVIYNQKSPEVVLGEDGWTIYTKDGRISGLFEETIAITKNGPLVLTPIEAGSFRLKNRGSFVC